MKRMFVFFYQKAPKNQESNLLNAILEVSEGYSTIDLNFYKIWAPLQVLLEQKISIFISINLANLEAVLQRCSYKKVFWKYAASLQEIENKVSTLRHGYSLVNLLHIFRTPFPMNISEGLLLQILWDLI